MSKRSSRTRPPLPGEASLDRELSDAVVFFHTAVAGHLGMGLADWKCLGLLERHGGMTAGRLAELSGFTTGAITGIVDRLERSGYASRQPNPADRRSVMVCPGNLDGLKETIRPIFVSLHRAMGRVTRNYSAAEREAVRNWLAETTRVLRAETQELRKPGRRHRAKKDGTNVSLFVPGGQ